MCDRKEWGTIWSNDRKSLVYTQGVDGVGDIGRFNVGDGTTRRLTATSQNEAGAELTPDGKTMLMRRMTIVQRLFTANLSKLLERSK